MTRRNDKRNNRRNRQRNNGNEEASKFASMMMGAIMGKAFEEVFGKKNDKESSGIQTEDCTTEPFNGVRNVNGNPIIGAIIKKDGTPTEIQLPDNIGIFINEEGKPMVYMKNGEEKAPDAEEGNPITYDDICKDLFFHKDTYYLDHNQISSWVQTSSNYNDFDNCTSIAQAKRMIAFNKLQNIAKYINSKIEWKPDFDNEIDDKYVIVKKGSNYTVRCVTSTNTAQIYFCSSYHANEAIRLMGEDSLNDLFSTDW